MTKALRDTLISVCLLLLLLAAAARLNTMFPTPFDALGSLCAYGVAIAVAAILATRAERRAPLSLLAVRHPLRWLPSLAPCLLLIYLAAWLCSYVGTLIGIQTNATLTEPLPLALIRHALLPAVAEELLFRYYPLRRLLPYGRRRAILISSLLFSLAHADILQSPYALLAGLLFAVLDTAAGSLLPSLLLHLLNNVLSVLTLAGALSDRSLTIGLLALLLPSVVLLILYRHHYRELLFPEDDSSPSEKEST